ncbi:hypothetical protein [Paenarthrobacter sp. TA1.8]|uniref:hypothetical protein n=1 Tax=Paenarthrobacter sp. TA1.8 TaxID=3400219 RepID=UPI003B429C33
MSRESQADATLSNYWSSTSPATAEQAANRKALPLDVKEALAAVARDVPLTAEQSTTLAGAGLAELDPKNTTWKFSEAKTVPVPVSKSSVAEPNALNLAAAQCWITTAEVQKWSFATQSFGWKRQVDWCADGSRVTSRHRDFPSVGYTDFTFHYRGADDIQANDVGGWQVASYQAATFEQCPTHLGCVSTYRPWIEFQLYGNNTATHTKGV